MREPASLARYVVVLVDRFLQDRVHGAVQADALVVVQRLDGPAWVQPRLPQDLVGDEVPDAGDEGLIHQRRFHAAPLSRQATEELPK